MPSTQGISSAVRNVSHKLNNLAPSKTVCNLPFEERIVGFRHHPNMLIEGPESHVEETLVALASDFHEDVYHWPVVPGHRIAPATVLIRNVTSLDQQAQDNLATLLEQGGPPVQVVATSSTPLFDRVDAGTFDSALYYRLNTLRVVLDERSSRTNQPAHAGR